MRYIFIIMIVAPVFLITSCSSDVRTKPNIIIFYVDDLGYGDLGCYGAKGVATPNIDMLASNGIRFTDAHCSAATCTPSRSALLTGRYAFRINAAVLPGDAPLLIDTAITTLPKMLGNAGYKTAVVGKWHLGLGYGNIDWNQRISPGPNEIGFDYSFLIPATGDRVPTVFVENGYVVNADRDDPIRVSYKKDFAEDGSLDSASQTLKMKADPQHSNTVVNGVSRIGYMSGGKNARWTDEEFPYVLNEKAIKFIDASEDDPFFLFYSFHDIHVPRMPHKNFAGKSTMGARGDAIAQMDWVVGQIIAALKKKGVDKNTLIIFTSDNGPVLNDGYDDRAEELIGEHKPAGPFRGGKYSAFEGGTRVPTILYWPDKITSQVSDVLLTQVDLLSSLASLVGATIPEDTDSENHLDAWLGENKTGRELMVEESSTLALREGNWKYIQPYHGTASSWIATKNIESGLTNSAQLYDLENDKAEQHNLADSLPQVVLRMEKKLKDIVEKK